MKKIYKRIINKIIILIYFLVVPVIASSAEFNQKKWTKKCNIKNENCAVGITVNLKNSTTGIEESLATAFIQMASSIEKKMALIDKDKKTYALKEKKIETPVLFVYLPLGINLTKKPLVQIDGKNILNLSASYCDNKVGCATNSPINDEVLKLLKSGNVLNLIAEIHGTKKNINIKLPLKGFTKSYNSF
jgi:invasion protein IalB